MSKLVYESDLKSDAERHVGSTPTTPTIRVYGPYLRRDGRKHVILYDGTNRKTVSYPRYLMEQHLGRKLKPNETVDHFDRDFTNDDISNLVVREIEEHSHLDAKFRKSKSFDCPQCNTQFKLKGFQLNDATQNREKGKAGPFCSRSCAGKYGAAVQNGRQAKLEVHSIVPEYFRIVKDDEPPF